MVEQDLHLGPQVAADESFTTQTGDSGTNADLSFVRNKLKTMIGTEQQLPIENKEGHWIPKFALLVISGKGSVGNTSTANFTADMYGIPSEQVFHAGEIFREYRDKMHPDHPDHASVAFIQRPEHLDKIVDELVIKKIMDATPDKPLIIEAKLGAALLRYVEQQARALGIALPAPRAAILKWADSDKRVEIARKKAGTEVLPLREIRRQSADRDRADLEQWDSVHPWLSEYRNILDKNAKDDEGNPLYQDIVDASDHKGPHEDFDDLNEKLVRLGLVVPKEIVMHSGEEIWMGYRPEDNLHDNPLVSSSGDTDDVDVVGVEHESYKPQFGNPF